MREKVREPEPPDVDRERGSQEVGERQTVLRIELGAPVDIDVVARRLARWIALGGNHHELLFEQRFNREAWTSLRRVHDRDIHPTIDQGLHQFFFEAD